MSTAPQRERFDPPKARRGFASRSQNSHRTTARAIRPTQSAQRVHFAFSKCAPRNSESDSTHPKCAEGSLCVFKMCTAPQRAMRPTQSAQRVHFAPRHSESNSTHPKCAEGSLCTHFACAKCAPRHSESDRTHPKCAKGSLHFQQMHHATARASRPTQSAAPATTSARKLESAAPATKSARKALKRCACHEICTKSSKVLRLSLKITLQRHAKRSKCCACHALRAEN